MAEALSDAPFDAKSLSSIISLESFFSLSSLKSPISGSSSMSSASIPLPPSKVFGLCPSAAEEITPAAAADAKSWD